ncbi:MAG TPA: cytochrome c oxidase subunit II [Burkholderiaceae bacterium]
MTMRAAGGWQDALLAHGPQAAQVLDLWRITLAVCSVVFALVLLALLLALWRTPRGTGETPPQTAPDDRRPLRRISAALAVSALLLLGLLAGSVATDRALAQLALRDALHIELTGHQWWWSIHYDDPDPSRTFDTANELHLPLGRPAILTLHSNDVIHSVWIPSLAGKKDLIPGRTTTLTLRADRAGLYRGQCAEFCGAQHAWMALPVSVDEPARFDAWADAQRAAAKPAADDLTRRGQSLVLNGDCAMCHAIRGTDANARQGPDLTHLAARGTLGAGALPNDAAHLAAWISDPAAHKPGVNMPSHAFAPDDLQAIVAYLGSLQ